MKNLLLFVFLFSMAGIVDAQLNVWSNPVPLTDSLTNNTQATLNLLDYYAGEDYYVFWAKTEDGGYSDIMVRRYYDQEEAVPVVYEGNYNYRNPKVIPIIKQNPDTLFFLFYEADIDGDYDIYYQVYTTSGYTSPVALTDNPTDDLNMDVANSGGIVWENNGTVFYTFLNGAYYNPIYFDTVMVVDSIDCSRPSISKDAGGAYPDYISWEKMVDDTSRVYLKEFYYDTWRWSDNSQISKEGANYHPKFSEGSMSDVPPTLCWDNFTSDSSVFIFYDPYDPEGDYFEPEFKQVSLYNPHIFNVFIGVRWLWIYAIPTFESEEQGQTDIYGGTESFSSYLGDYVNISNSAAIDRNPYLFGGYFGTCQDILNIWESYRNGHWVLYTSQITVPLSGGTKEFDNQNKMNLTASPNPFRDMTTINFSVPDNGPVSLFIYDCYGRKVRNLGDKFYSSATNSVIWKGDDDQGLPVLPGIYFCRLISGNHSVSARIIVL